jgi:glycosyltransferase involved in cell wall biosynthesis
VRILIAHSFYRLAGGEDRYVHQQMELLGRSHEVELLSARNAALDAGFATAARMVYSRPRVGDVEASIRRFRPDVVHLHNPYPALGPAVGLAAASVGVPLVMTVHNYRLRCPNGYLFTEGQVCRRCERGAYANAVLHRCFPSAKQSAAYAVALWVHRFLLRLEDRVALFIAPSHFIADQLTAWGFPRHRIRMIRNFTDATPVNGSTLGEHGLYVGRLSAEKGVDVLLRALRLADDPPFVIVGDGPDKVRLERLATDLGLTGLRFAGRLARSHVRESLQAARFVVFPSLWHENAPLAALEAMAAGRPLIVTARGGLPELAADGRGLVCRPGDADDLAEKIRLLGRDDDACARAGDAALAFARDQLDPAAHAAGLLRAYAAARTQRHAVSRSGSDAR